MCTYVCVCVCVCARIRAEFRGAHDTESVTICNAVLETEMICCHVHKISNRRLFSLFNKRTRYRPVL